MKIIYYNILYNTNAILFITDAPLLLNHLLGDCRCALLKFKHLFLSTPLHLCTSLLSNQVFFSFHFLLLEIYIYIYIYIYYALLKFKHLFRLHHCTSVPLQLRYFFITFAFIENIYIILYCILPLHLCVMLYTFVCTSSPLHLFISSPLHLRHYLLLIHLYY